MPGVLTKASTLVCAHQGTVQLIPSQIKLKVDGQSVLVMGDIVGNPIAGCVTPVTPASKPCTTVVSMITGAATELKVDGKPVLLETAMGMTDGVTPAPTNTWNVRTAGQTKLSSK